MRPKVIASTATIRRAAEQVHALFWRRVEVFPPQVLDAGDSFFAKQRPTSDVAGRLYLGICAPGVRLKAVEARVFTTVLSAAQKLFENYGKLADPWMTMVGYFNALRELGGARRIIEDDVTNRMRRAGRKGLGRRSRPVLRELTSRVSSSDIAEILDQLGVVHVPDRPRGGTPPIDVLLATNMISVGVDVPRLGLMVAVGQPKATAEYIQATSRVGRDLSGPGLRCGRRRVGVQVCTPVARGTKVGAGGGGQRGGTLHPAVGGTRGRLGGSRRKYGAARGTPDQPPAVACQTQS